MEKRRIEILAPAGPYASFKAAINAGADAVYAGGPKFGARAYADNFTKEELIEAIKEAHIYGRKLYLTVNTLLKNNEISELPEYLSPLYEAGLDAVIVQDIGVLELVREYFPKMDIHASTQMTITGYRGAAFMEGQGISRVVPARAYDQRQNRVGDRMFCTWCTLLLLFRSMPFKQHDRRTQREQRSVCSALQTAVYSRR